MEEEPIDLNLIPFGLDPKKRTILDVADVSRGKNCGCVCPSCETPLVARQGDVKEWHFAHASRDVYSQTKRECSYSFYLSVRMMARQIIDENLEIVLPELEGSVGKYVDDIDEYIDVPFTIAAKQTVSLTNVVVERNFQGIPVDITGQVKDFSFIVYFTHPGREVPFEFSAPDDSKCGIVSISLDGINLLLVNARRLQTSYKTTLQNFLARDVKSKTWVFHPRYALCEKEANNKLRDLEYEHRHVEANHRKKLKRTGLRTVRSGSSIAVIAPETQSKRLANYECIICHILWQGWDPGASKCPKCNKQLYRVIKGYADDQT